MSPNLSISEHGNHIMPFLGSVPGLRKKNSRSTPSGIIWQMSHTNPRADRRPLGNLQGWESTRIRRKDVLFNFHSVAKYENSGRPGARTRARRAHQFYVPRSNHYAIRTWFLRTGTEPKNGIMWFPCSEIDKFGGIKFFGTRKAYINCQNMRKRSGTSFTSILRFSSFSWGLEPRNAIPKLT